MSNIYNIFTYNHMLSGQVLEQILSLQTVIGYFFTGEPLPHTTFKNLKIKLCLKQLKAYAL